MPDANDLARTASMSLRFNRMLRLIGPQRSRFRGWAALKSTVDKTYEATPALMYANVADTVEKIEYAAPIRFMEES